MGQFEFAGEEELHVVAWDVETGELINYIPDLSVIGDTAINPDRMLVFTGLGNGMVELWDLETGQVIFSFEGHNNHVDAVAISPDGTRALSAADDGGILWTW